MAFDPTFALLAAIMLLAYTTEAATGFGSIVITVTLGLHLYPIPTVLEMVVPMSILISTIILRRHWRNVDRALLLTRVLPLMFAGGAVGYLLAAKVEGDTLKRAFGVFIVLVSIRELYLLVRKTGAVARPAGAARPLPAPVRVLGMLAAGFIHGIYASGGPMLVYVISRSGLDKARFRATLQTVWLTLNTTLTVVFIATGRLTLEHVPYLGTLAIVVLAAIALGSWLHNRLPERQFRIAVYALLLISGASAAV